LSWASASRPAAITAATTAARLLLNLDLTVRLTIEHYEKPVAGVADHFIHSCLGRVRYEQTPQSANHRLGVRRELPTTTSRRGMDVGFPSRNPLRNKRPDEHTNGKINLTLRGRDGWGEDGLFHTLPEFLFGTVIGFSTALAAAIVNHAAFFRLNILPHVTHSTTRILSINNPKLAS
jgi:hypothetical protein